MAENDLSLFRMNRVGELSFLNANGFMVVEIIGYLSRLFIDLCMYISCGRQIIRIFFFEKSRLSYVLTIYFNYSPNNI